MTGKGRLHMSSPVNQAILEYRSPACSLSPLPLFRYLCYFHFQAPRVQSWMSLNSAAQSSAMMPMTEGVISTSPSRRRFSGRRSSHISSHEGSPEPALIDRSPLYAQTIERLSPDPLDNLPGIFDDIGPEMNDLVPGMPHKCYSYCWSNPSSRDNHVLLDILSSIHSHILVGSMTGLSRQSHWASAVWQNFVARHTHSS